MEQNFESIPEYPETIVEIYDDEQIYNVLAVTEFKPKNVVYIGTRKLKSKRIKNNLISCLRSLGLDTRCFFYSTDMLSLDAIIAELAHINELFPGMVIDLTGGSEVALVAVGMLAKEKGIPLMRYDAYEHRYRNIYEFPEAEALASSPHFTVQSYLRLMGGDMKAHGHLAVDSLDDETREDIIKVWEIYKRRNRTWPRVVAYLQQVSKRDGDDDLTINAPAMVYSGEKLVGCDSAIMQELADAGVIKGYKNNGGRLEFTYKSGLMKSCLIDTGICLELYVFATALTSADYDDVKISVVVDWDGDLTPKINTINEIDVMLTRGYIPVFISCKSGTPNVVALNEIKTLAKQFGGVYGRPVLVTMADVKGRDAYFMQRAEDMGVTVIDYSDLVNDRLPKRLSAAARI